MKSPFPGMDPYLEQHWRDIHASLIIYSRDQLEEQLPGNLIARVEERVVIEPEEGNGRSIYPDVRIVEHPRGATSAAVSRRTSVMEPVIVHYRSEPATETFINILDPAAKHSLVTVIEIRSMANKLPGEGQRQYRRKQEELAAARVSLVEVDLLRAGVRVLSVPLREIPGRVRTTYQVCVRRGWLPGRFEVYSVPLRRPLPTIKIPLRKKDKDVHLDLQSVVEQAYRKGRYYSTIRYEKPTNPPLTGSDSKWARALVKKAKTG